MKRLKRGFTLIELLAVIVILAVIMLVAGQNVFKILDDAQKGAFRTEFLDFLNSAQLAAQMDVMNGKLTASNPSKCYSYQQLTEEYGYYDQKSGYNGSVQVYYTNGNFTISGWLSSSQYMITDANDTVTTDDIDDANGASASATCGR